MKPCFSFFVSCAACLLAGQVALAGLPVAVDGRPLPSLAPVLERVTPAVVNIHTQTRVRVNSPFANDPFFRRFFGLPKDRVSQSLGSGVIVDAQRGFILTNNHVIKDADDILVTLHDGRNVPAKLIGTDPDTEVAVIQIAVDNLSQLPLADSDALRVGDFVVAVGNPFGLGQTVTSGIVSALGRRSLRGLHYQNFIQTDASINPGNSGGALVNLRGELIGINTAIYSPTGGNIGIGFAIPSRIAEYVMDELITHGTVRRGTLGVALQDMSAQLAEALGTAFEYGALVTRVADDSSASTAGLQTGDVITALDGEKIGDAAALRNAEGLLQVGRDVALVYSRDGQQQSTRIQVAATAISVLPGQRLHPLLGGARLADIDPQLALDSGLQGVLVTEVIRGSSAWQYGLRRGDLIRSINRQLLVDLAAMVEQVNKPQSRLLLPVN